MASSLDNIWNEVLNLIKVELTEVSFNTWLKTIEPISISSGKVVLAAPNEFTKGILVGRYLNLIKNAFSHVTEEEFDIQFIIPGEEYSLNIGQTMVQEVNDNNQRS
ncbi:DnaA N-terminal domain-containing protein, partial [Tissierella praeacuta]